MTKKLAEDSRGVLERWKDDLTFRWDEFEYNFGWPDWVWLYDSWLTKSAIGVPVVGYLILFNDTVASHLSFEHLTDSSRALSFLPSEWRLRFVYFGMLALGIANFLYYWRRPYVMKIGKSRSEYVANALATFTIGDFNNLHGRIRSSDRDPMTVYGKFYDDEWTAFQLAATGYAERKEGVAVDWNKVHWVDAKNRFESLLRSILIETYFREGVSRRLALSVCITFGIAGLALLLIPSFDLFLRVLGVVFLKSSSGAST